MGIPLKQLGLFCVVATAALSAARFGMHHTVDYMHPHQSFQKDASSARAEYHADGAADYITDIGGVPMTGMNLAPARRNHGALADTGRGWRWPVAMTAVEAEHRDHGDDATVPDLPHPELGEAVGVLTALARSRWPARPSQSQQSRPIESRASRSTRYQHGLKHHPRQAPAKPTKPTPAISSPTDAAASSGTTRPSSVNLREWLPPDDPLEKEASGTVADAEDAERAAEQAEASADDGELPSPWDTPIELTGEEDDTAETSLLEERGGVGLRREAVLARVRGSGGIAGFLSSLLTGHRSPHSLMDVVTNALHAPELPEGDVEAEMDEKPGVPENHESHPAVKRLLAKRTPHAGPWMKLTWPPHSSKPPIHMHLNYRQFVEDGHLPDPRRSKGINSRAWVSYLAESSQGKMLHKYVFHNKLLPLLPKQDVKWHFRRCAVVLNSGQLLASRFGGEIDAHDAVVRVNYPPIENFTQHVGSKTTFDFTNHHNAQELLNPNSERFVPLHQGTRAVQPNSQNPANSTLVLFETPNSEGWRLSFLPEISNRFPASVAILSPDFMVAAEEVWRNVSGEVAEKGEACLAMKRRIERAGDYAASSSGRKQFGRGIGAHSIALRLGLEQACKPTSGWFALMFAYQACDEVSVYGFSAWRKQRDGLQQAPYHYFDQVHGVTNVHSFDLSKRCLQKLAETYKITLK